MKKSVVQDLSFLENFYKKFGIKFINILPNIILAIIVFILGYWLIKFIMHLLKKSLIKYETEPSLGIFFRKITKFALYSLLIISIISLLGFPTTSFIAILSAAGIAVGLALQGSLANFAGGILILFFKPFKIGDTILSNNNEGTVERIDILHTTIITADNKTIIMPNGQLANNNVLNYSKQTLRRVEINLSVTYKTDIKKLRQIVLDILKADKRIIDNPFEPFVVLNNLGEFSMNIIIRFWTTTELHLNVYWENLEKIKDKLEEKNIEIIPSYKREINIIKQ